MLKLLQQIRSVNSRKADIARTLASDSKRSFWALADQAVVSLGNFAVPILLARYFDKHGDISSFGAFWILMEPLLFLNGIQAALLIYPLTIRGAVADRQTLGRMGSQSVILTLAMGPVMSVVLVVTALIARVPLQAALWASVAMICWQAQEAVRRGLMSHLRFRSALLGDALSYLGQAAGIGLLVWYDSVSLVRVFQVLAVTSAAGAVLQGIQLRLSWTGTVSGLRGYCRDCWSVGRWMMMGNLSGFITGPLFAWNLAYWVGKEGLGILYAVAVLLRPINPLQFAIATLITPNAARILPVEGIGGAKQLMYRFGLLGMLLSAPYLCLLLLAPKFSIALFYGQGSQYEQWTLMLQLATLVAALAYAASVTGALLNAVERSRDTFVGQLMLSLGMLAVGMTLTAFFGIMGAVVGTLIATIMHLATHLYYVRKLPENEPAQLDEHPARPQLLPAAGG